MWRRHLIVLVVLVALAVVAVPALSAVTPTGPTAVAKITVKPAVGTPHTRFAVTFASPGPVGPGGALATHYAVMASDRRQTGCASSASATIAGSLPGSRLKLWLDPPLGSRWCAGTFHARILEYQTLVCGPLHVCPQFIRFVGTIGKFSFRVKRAG
jgi:hypothetical protein